MLNILDFALFKLINDHTRMHFLDLFLPIFANNLFFIGFVLFLLIIFAITCQKVYGNFFWRLMALSLLLVSTICTAYFSSYFWKDTFERNRPINTLSQVVFFDLEQKAWVKTGAQETSSEIPVEVPTQSEETPVKAGEPLQASAQKTVEHPAITGSTLQYQEKSFTAPQLQAMHEHVGFSIPSSVAACSMAVALIISLLLPRSTPWIYIVPILIGWARIYAGFNFPLDILVGWIWGIICVAISWLILDFILRKFSKTRKL